MFYSEFALKFCLFQKKICIHMHVHRKHFFGVSSRGLAEMGKQTYMPKKKSIAFRVEIV